MFKLRCLFFIMAVALTGILSTVAEASPSCSPLFTKYNPISALKKAQVLTSQLSREEYDQKFQELKLEAIESELVPFPVSDLFEFSLRLRIPSKRTSLKARAPEFFDFTYRFKINGFYEDTPSALSGVLTMEPNPNPFSVFPKEIEVQVYRREQSLTESSFQFVLKDQDASQASPIREHDPFQMSPFFITVDWNTKKSHLFIKGLGIENLKVSLTEFKIQDLLSNREMAMAKLLQQQLNRQMTTENLLTEPPSEDELGLTGIHPDSDPQLLSYIFDMKANLQYAGFRDITKTEEKYLFSTDSTLNQNLFKGYFHFFMFSNGIFDGPLGFEGFKHYEGVITGIGSDSRGEFIELDDGYSYKRTRVYRNELFLGLAMPIEEIPTQMNPGFIEKMKELKEARTIVQISRGNGDRHPLESVRIVDVRINPKSQKLTLSLESVTNGNLYIREISELMDLIGEPFDILIPNEQPDETPSGSEYDPVNY